MSAIDVSFEFFPPRDEEGINRLITKVAEPLRRFQPKYYSVTYGAGGSTRDGTRETVANLISAGFTASPHLSMGSDGQDDVRQTLDNYVDLGVGHIVALRGDQPSGMGTQRFENNAEALVTLIRDHLGEGPEISVAAYPEVHPDAKSAESDLDFFEAKVKAGATRAITQYFYNVDAYANFVERVRARGMDIPIVPGIMPINNYEAIVRFSANCGAEIPRWLDKQLAEKQQDEQDLKDFAVDMLSAMCERLIALGAPGLHFYTLNRWGASTRICDNLSL